jgi:RimJ/RimL family protein N-acetyltransferase
MSAAPTSLTDKPVKFGGVPHRIRLLHSGDEEILRAFFRSHTPETIYERYGYPVPDMNFDRASQLVGVDQSKDCAVGIFETSPLGEALDAVGRYCLDADGRGAEAAFVVRESKRNLGMAGALLGILTTTARERGLDTLWAQLSPDNGPMMAVFRRAGFTLTPLGPGEGVKAALQLKGKPAKARAAPKPRRRASRAIRKTPRLH